VPTLQVILEWLKNVEQLTDLLLDCERLHGHLCPGQVLGARMSMLGCELLGLRDPRGADRKKLIVWVEIDRCMADAVSAVTGVRLGRRSLKFFDYGKVAATFLHTETGQAVRIVALDSSRALADERYPALESKKERQMRAYIEAEPQALFKVDWVQVDYDELDAPGKPQVRVQCSLCGEGVNDGREVLGAHGEKLCRPCASGGYYQALPPEQQIRCVR
jgi:formylmethanofuran dehydrogenase subunit E